MFGFMKCDSIHFIDGFREAKGMLKLFPRQKALIFSDALVMGMEKQVFKMLS